MGWIRHPWLDDDIAEVLAFTLKRFGIRQYLRYEAIIQDAFDHLVEHPKEGSPCRSLSGGFTFHIRRPGRRARHQFLYVVQADGTVFVLRLLHDAMDISRHVPPH